MPDKAFWFVFPAGLFQNHLFYRPLLCACLCEKSPANISICRLLCLPFSFQWISNGFFKWSLRYIRPFKAWPKRGWDGQKLGLRAGYVALTSRTGGQRNVWLKAFSFEICSFGILSKPSEPSGSKSLMLLWEKSSLQIR